MEFDIARIAFEVIEDDSEGLVWLGIEEGQQ